MAERSVYVIATTPDGTARALLEAKRLAAGAARIVMLVPVPLHAAPVSTELMDKFSAIAGEVGVSAVSYACVCHQPQDILPLFQIGEATLVVGGSRGRRFTPTLEQKLVETLSNIGHNVVFAEVGCDGGGPRSEVTASTKAGHDDGA